MSGHAGAVRLAVGVVVVAALAACGGAGPQTAMTADDFARGFLRVTVSYQERTDAVKAEGRGAMGQGPDRVLAVYGSMREAIHSARLEYQTLRPPSEVKPTFDRLVNLLKEQEAAIDAVVTAAKANDGAGLSQALSQLAQQFSDWAKARTDVEGRISKGS